MRHAVTRQLPYRAEDLFDLVADVQSYPAFVPWITGMRTWNSRVDGTGVGWIDAEVQVGFSVLRERFSTRVRKDRQAQTVDVALLAGPFHHLRNSWHFSGEGQTTSVAFDIDFAFKSSLLQTMLTRNFEHAVDRLMGCFEARAQSLYN